MTLSLASDKSSGLNQLTCSALESFPKNLTVLQVVSSAIMNAPPPMGVVTVLHTCSNAHMSGIDKATKEKMVS